MLKTKNVQDWTDNFAKMIHQNITASIFLDHLRQTGTMQILMQHKKIQAKIEEFNQAASGDDSDTVSHTNVAAALEAARNTSFFASRGITKDLTNSEIHDVSVWWNIFSFLSYGDVVTNRPEPRVVELDDGDAFQLPLLLLLMERMLQAMIVVITVMTLNYVD